MRPDLDSVACFVTAAKTLNFRAAAKVQALTPAALGKRIRQLEDLFDVQLFHRTTRRVELTHAGRALLPEAERLLAQASVFVNAARQDQSPLPIDVILGTRHELGMSWIIPLRARLKEIRPDVTIHLYFGSGVDLEERLLSLQVDCVVSSRVPSTRRIDTQTLHREDYVLVAAPTLLERIPFIAPIDAKLHTLVDLSNELPLFNYWDSSSGTLLRFNNLLRVGTIAGIRELVLHGEGVAVLPEYFVRKDLADDQLVRLLPDIALKADYFRLQYRADDPRQETFLMLSEFMQGVPLQ